MLTLQLHTLCEFANAIPSSRNLIEGQKVVNSGMIIIIGVTSKSNESIELFALCLQTSALTSEPHTITGTLKINDSNNNYLTRKMSLLSIECHVLVKPVPVSLVNI